MPGALTYSTGPGHSGHAEEYITDKNKVPYILNTKNIIFDNY